MLDFTESVPNSVMLAISHAVYVKGDQTNFEIEPSFGVEASSLYPDVKYTTVDELLDQFVWGKKKQFRTFVMLTYLSILSLK